MDKGEGQGRTDKSGGIDLDRLAKTFGGAQNVEDIYPASPLQSGIIYQSEIVPGSYISSTSFVIDGDLDIEAFRAAWDGLVLRHTILRTGFYSDDIVRPVQVVTAGAEKAFRFLDWSGDNPGELAGRVAEIANEETSTPFDLARPPLMRLCLIALPGKKHRIIWAVHHAILDGWSCSLLFAELMSDYASKVKGGSMPVAPSAPYKEYMAWLLQQDSEAVADFWTGLLASPPTGHLLSSTAMASSGPSPDRTIHSVPLHISSTREDVERFVADNQITLFVLLQSVWAIVLGRLTGVDDVIFGAIFSGRSADLDQMEKRIGLFINTLPVRAKLNPDENVLEWLGNRQSVARDYWRHEHTPLSKILDWTNTGRAENLFDSLLIFENYPLDSEIAGRIGGLDIADFEVVETPHYPLTVQVYYRPDGELGLRCYFDSGVLSEDVVTAIGRAFDHVLTSILTSPEVRLADIALAEVEPSTSMLDPTAPQESKPADGETICDILEQVVERSPDLVAIEDGDLEITFATLDREAEGLANYLAAQGVQPGHRVAILMERSSEAIVAMFAILKLAACYVPLDPSYPLRRLNQLIADADISVAVTKPEFDFDGKLEATVVTADCRLEAERMRTRPRSDSAAYINYTSGSTGIPKGVCVSHAAVCNFATADSPVRLQERWRVSHLSNLSFDAVVFEIWSALLVGGTIVVIDRPTVLDPAALAKAVETLKIDAMFLTTAVFNLVADFRAKAFSGVKRLYFGGEAADCSAVKSVLASSGTPEKLFNVYGPTEATAFCLGYEIRELGREATTVPIGKPISNMHATILDHLLQPLPPYIVGEVYLSGAGLAQGYVAQPARTAEAFLPAPNGHRMYRTGDLAIQEADGSLVFKGRADRQVKIRGHRIEPAEIERVIKSVSDVRQVSVQAVQQKVGGKQLVAMLAVDDVEAFDRDQLKDRLKGALPGYMCPSSYRVFEQLPLNANGKIDLSLIADATTPDAGGDRRPDSISRTVLSICASLLANDDLRLSDSFFDVGGHSLLAAKLSADLSREFEMAIPVIAVLEQETLGDLALWIEGELASGNAQSDATIEIEANVEDRFKPFPLNDIQRAYWLGRKNIFTLGDVPAYAYSEVDFRDLDADRFLNALSILIKRHDALRLVINEGGDQQILPVAPKLKVPIHDFTELSEGEYRVRCDEIRERLSKMMLPLGRWPMFAIEISRLPDDRVRLHFGIDALICDAWSVSILTNELLALYFDLEAALPDVGVSFRDYVVAEKNYQFSEAFANSVDFWKAKVADFPQQPSLPLKRKPETIEKAKFKTIKHTLDASAFEALKTNAARFGSTPTTAILTLFCELLARFSGQSRFGLNLTTFNRQAWHSDINRLVGDFTALMPFDADLRGLETFADRLQALQAEFWNCFEHRTAGSWFLRELRRREGESSKLVLPVVFTSALGMTVNNRLGDTAKLVFNSNQTPQVWLDFQIAETADGLVCHWSYVDSLFMDDLVPDMADSFLQSLIALSGDAKAWDEAALVALPPSQASNRAESLENEVSLPVARLESLFFSSAEKHPDRPAIITEERTLSYAETKRHVSALSARLGSAGVAPGDNVGIVCASGWEAVVGVLAVLASGAVYVPIAATNPAERLRTLISEADVGHVVAQSHLLGSLDLPRDVKTIPVGDTDMSDLSEVEEIAPRSGTDELAYVIYTSGSTGKPKGVAITHAAACNTILAINRMANITESDRILGVSALTFDLSVYDMFGIFAAGGALVLPKSSALPSPAHWRGLILQHSVTIWNSVPALLELLLADESGELAESKLRLAMLSGDWIGLGLPDKLRAVLPNAAFLAMGGATEAGIWSIFKWVDEVDPDWPSIPYGLALPNQSVMVLDDRHLVAPDWVKGEIIIGGVGLATGYYNSKELTDQKFIRLSGSGERVYRTGDCGRYLPNGEIEFLGRIDRQVKLNGYRIELSEIEAALQALGGIDGCIVIVHKQPGHRQSLVAYIVAQGGSGTSAAAIQEQLSAHLPAFMIPSHYIELDRLPLSANGKVDASSLPVPKIDDRAASSRPVDEVERRIAEIWKSLLKIDEVDTNRAFYDLGGDSLLVALLGDELEKEFGLGIPIEHVFEKSTIALQAELVRAATAKISAG